MENNKEMSKWLDDFNLDHPLVIAGPCSAETENQVLKTANELKETDVSVFRAGIWKPRTKPGMFEGVGAIGLKWLQKVKTETGLLTSTEVANSAHVKLALEHDVDVLWIGARSTVSPFIVQEIADALNGTKKIVLVKNGYLEKLFGENKWGAPKGHIKENSTEDFVECAEREIWEESGLQIRINRNIPKVQVRNTMYYPIQLDKEYPVKSNDEKEISNAKWVSLDLISAMNINRELKEALVLINRFKSMAGYGKCIVLNEKWQQ